LLECRDAVGEVGANLRVHVQSLEVWKISVLNSSEAKSFLPEKMKGDAGGTPQMTVMGPGPTLAKCLR
jgi:hypothetical protein